MTAGGNGQAAAPHTPDPELYLVYEFERRAYALREAFTIGRDTGSDLVVLEPTVSRTHARVSAHEGGWFLESVGPTGTRVNGVRLELPYQLAYGDKIEIGTAVLTVRSAPLPLGVATADGARVRALDAIAARRTTIKHPLMTERPMQRRRPWSTWLAVAAALAVVAALLLRA